MQNHTMGNNLNHDFEKQAHLGYKLHFSFYFEPFPKQENKHEFWNIRIFHSFTIMEVPHDQLHDVRKEIYC